MPIVSIALEKLALARSSVTKVAAGVGAHASRLFTDRPRLVASRALRLRFHVLASCPMLLLSAVSICLGVPPSFAVPLAALCAMALTAVLADIPDRIAVALRTVPAQPATTRRHMAFRLFGDLRWSVTELATFRRTFYLRLAWLDRLERLVPALYITTMPVTAPVGLVPHRDFALAAATVGVTLGLLALAVLTARVCALYRWLCHRIGGGGWVFVALGGAVAFFANIVAQHELHAVTRLDPGQFQNALVVVTALSTILLIWISGALALIGAWLLAASLALPIAFLRSPGAAAYEWLRPMFRRRLLWLRGGERRIWEARKTTSLLARWATLHALSLPLWILFPALAPSALSGYTQGVTLENVISSLVVAADFHGGSPCVPPMSGARVLYCGGDCVVIARWSPADRRHSFHRGSCATHQGS